MQTTRIYHGGGVGKSGGFGPAVTPPVIPTIDFVRTWISINDFSPHTSNPPNGPMTRVLPNTLQARCYAFSASELDLLFCLVPVPSVYWTYDLTVPTSVSVKLYWYVEVTSAKYIAWRTELSFIREFETLNFALPLLTDMSRPAGTQYELKVSTVPDFPIYNPSGSSVIDDGIFYFKCGRDGTHIDDTYTNEAYLLGATIDFPILY